MEHNINHVLTGFVVMATLVASPARAEDKSAAGKPDAQMQELMKKMETAGTPGQAHKTLDPLVGNWTAEVKCWMGPDAPPTVTRATANASWILNGRFVQEEFNGEFLGKPFRGISLTGYDNVKQKYTTVWVDDMHTAMVTAEGEAEDGGKVITLEGKYDCPMTGQKDVPMKQVIRIISPEKRVFEMHDPRQGEHSKTMEITYTATKRNVADTKRR